MSLQSSLGISAVILFLVPAVCPQGVSSQTMRPVIRGRHAAVASMKAEATEAARRARRPTARCTK